MSNAAATNAPSPEDLQRLAEGVHTYESFGRAIVAGALEAAARRGVNGDPLTPSVTIRPATRPGRHQDDDDLHGGAAGPVAAECYTIAYVWYEGGPVHHIRICMD